MKKVFCLGESLIDFVAEKQGGNLSGAKTFTKKAGGAPANVACAISKLGGRSSFIGCVGNDPFGDFLLEVLLAHSVETKLAQRSEVFTTLAFVSLAEDGERDFVFSRGADRELKYDPGIKTNFDQNILHLGAATALLGGSLEEAYGRYLFDALTKDTIISFDPNFRADLWKDLEQGFIRKCLPFVEKSHLCKFSKEEAQLLSGKKDVAEACNFLHDVGTRIITVTLGSEGTLLSTPERKEIVQSIPVDPVDTTGAGDAFIGCLLYQLASLDKLENALEDHDLLINMVRRANIAGAITTTNYGAIASLPTKEELEQF
ncbi:MAG: carbohydrate kinase [Flavobacteriaceae bacterium]